MSIFDWFHRTSRQDPQHKAIAEERLQRVMSGFQAELESMKLPDESVEPGQMPEVLSRPMVDYEGDQADYPWEKKRADAQPADEARRRY